MDDETGGKRLRLYDTLTKRKVDFAPIDPSNVRMYVCGPTVYDDAHIGNARPVIVFDVLFRLLRHLYGEAHVTYARNITDVDDKINARAARDFPGLPLNEAIGRVTAATEAQFKADAAALGCLPPTHEPRATEHIGEMRALIERLVERGVAYVAEDHVLFSPTAMAERMPAPKYGALARRPLDEMIAGARVDVAPYKRDVTDFVLWKPSKTDEPGWPSPCGINVSGRPGWHIECSAMSMAKLLEPFGGGLACDDPAKNVFDVHGGGIDLVFPHHENEIAQSCCAFGSERMAQVWMHNGFLQVEGEKMSKSLGNFITIQDLLHKFPGDAIRFQMLSKHYSQPIDWTEARSFAAMAELESWAICLSQYFRDDFSNEVPTTMIDALSNDLNTPDAISILRELYKKANSGSLHDIHMFANSCKLIGLKDLDKPGYFQTRVSGLDVGQNSLSVSEADVVGIRAALANSMPQIVDSKIASINSRGLEIRIDEDGYMTLTKPDFDQVAIDTLINARLEARRAKNFAESDRIRDELVAMGIQIMDAKDPVTGELTTRWEVKR